jgi:hypothetical protein
MKNPKIQAILRLIADMIGQSQVYTECGGDFPCGASSGWECKHWQDCQEQLLNVDKTRKLIAMIEGI